MEQQNRAGGKLRKNARSRYSQPITNEEVTESLLVIPLDGKSAGSGYEIVPNMEMFPFILLHLKQTP